MIEDSRVALGLLSVGCILLFAVLGWANHAFVGPSLGAGPYGEVNRAAQGCQRGVGIGVAVVLTLLLASRLKKRGSRGAASSEQELRLSDHRPSRLLVRALHGESDRDLFAHGADLRERRGPQSPPVAPKLFEGLRAGIALHAVATEPLHASVSSLSLTDADIAGFFAPRRRLRDCADYVFAFQDHERTMVGLQHREEVLLIRRGLIRQLTLEKGIPARAGSGGYSVSCTLSGQALREEVSSTNTHVDSCDQAGQGTVGATFWFDLDYHLSEAGAFRLLAMLSGLGEFIQAPVWLHVYSDV